MFLIVVCSIANAYMLCFVIVCVLLIYFVLFGAGLGGVSGWG